MIPPPKKLLSKCPALLRLINLVIPVFAAEAAAVKPNGNNTFLAERIASLINGHANLLSTIE